MKASVRLREPASGMDVVADGVVFDLDGVLVDTGPWWPVAEKMAITRLGGHWRGVDDGTLAGKAPDVAAELLAQRHGLHIGGVRLEKEIENAAADVFRSRVRGVPDAEAVLRKVSGSRVAVATNSPRRVAEASLASAGFERFIDVLVAADDVPRGKPDPCPYLRACEQLGVDPPAAIAIDDTDTGIRSALAAGMIVVGFGRAVLGAVQAVSGWVPDWSNVDIRTGPQLPVVSASDGSEPVRR